MSDLLTGTAYAGLPLWSVLLVAVIVYAGSFVQASIGLGLGLLGAPLVALFQPELVPTMFLFLAVPVATVVTASEWRHISWFAVRWALPARVPGTVLGVWLVATFSETELGVAVAVMVLLAVALSLRSLQVPFNRPGLFGTGLVAGTTGTATAIGGPPLAIAMARRPPSEARATMSLFFVVGSVMSLVWFAATGALTSTSWQMALANLPAVALGLLTGMKVRDRIPRERFRTLLLGLCAAAGVLLLAKSLVGG